jgi:hypothetical protein
MTTDGTSRNCPSCGAEIAAGGRFCPDCGGFVPGAGAGYEDRALLPRLVRSLALLVWFMTWPLSAVFGTPREAKQDVPWRRALGLIFWAAVAATVIIVVTVALDRLA